MYFDGNKEADDVDFSCVLVDNGYSHVFPGFCSFKILNLVQIIEIVLFDLFITCAI